MIHQLNSYIVNYFTLFKDIFRDLRSQITPSTKIKKDLNHKSSYKDMVRPS